MDKVRSDLKVVCRCKAITFKSIRIAISRGYDTIEKIKSRTGANTGCKCCTDELKAILEDLCPESDTLK